MQGVGTVVKTGGWLRISGNVFLTMLIDITFDEFYSFGRFFFFFFGDLYISIGVGDPEI